MIFVTPNPALDHTLVVPRLLPGEIHRPSRVILVAGGKGLNAARAVRILGGNPLCMGLIGGVRGEIFSRLASEEGFRTKWTPIGGETRTCIMLVDESGNDPTGIYEPGPQVSSAEWENFVRDISSSCSGVNGAARLICISGSMPNGIPFEAFQNTIHRLKQGSQKIWVDTSSPSLNAAIAAKVYGIKINAAEAGAAVGYSLFTIREVISGRPGNQPVWNKVRSDLPGPRWRGAGNSGLCLESRSTRGKGSQ